MTPLLHTARFALTCAAMPDLPEDGLPEVAFVGRSNAGKSTCINVLTQQRRLAFASKTPGRTQHINYFAVGRQRRTIGYLVDLPGYGYASVPQAAKLRWQRFLGQYLHERASLAALVLIADSRIGLTELDLRLLDFVGARALPVHVLIAKSDKLGTQQKAQALARAEQQLGQWLAASGSAAELSVQTFSATTREGLDDLAGWVQSWLEPAPDARPKIPHPGDDAEQGRQ